MRNKYHKIPGVALDVCTCEQKIAYNAAFYTLDGYIRDTWKKKRDTVSGVARSAFIADCVSACMDALKRDRAFDRINTRYNVDMIFSALNAGVETYLNGNSVLWDYETIGNTFPALYL